MFVKIINNNMRELKQKIRNLFYKITSIDNFASNVENVFTQQEKAINRINDRVVEISRQLNDTQLKIVTIPEIKKAVAKKVVEKKAIKAPVVKKTVKTKAK